MKGLASMGVRWLASGLSSFLLGNPLYLLAAAALVFAVGSYAGWTVNGWRLGTKLEHERGEVKRLTGEVVTLHGINQRCAVDVEAVSKAVNGVVAAAAERVESAAKAMKQAEGQAKTHSQRATEILSRPPVAPAEHCRTIVREMQEFAALRMDKSLTLKGEKR